MKTESGYQNIRSQFLYGILDRYCGLSLLALFLCQPLFADQFFTTQQARLTASDKAAHDNLGQMSVLSGNTAVVGAPGADPGGVLNAGAAYVFVRSGSNWTQQAKLTASDGAALDDFAANHSLAIDGNTILVGAAFANIDGKVDAGAVYVFVRSGTNWTQQAKLVAGDAAAGDVFGFGVALAGDTALIGANGARPGGMTSAGAAYIFTRSGTNWTQQAKLTASDKSAHAGFGNSVALFGETALVGASREDSGGLIDGGAAYVFVRSGTTWTEQAKLMSNNRAADDGLGDAVALSGDTALLGAQTSGVGRSGRAYVFVRNGTSWSQQAQLTASTLAGEARFGYSVAVSGDVALVGASYMMAVFDPGKAYVFTRSGTTWTQQSILAPSDPTANDNFGRSVALSGGTALVGAFAADPNGVSNAGAAYVFTTPVNQPPKFGKSGNQVVIEDFGPRTVPNWATDIRSGPAGETAQQVTFVVTNNNPALFAAGGQPAITADGSLSYTPASEAGGVAAVTVRLQDDGGTIDGGADSGSSQTFSITVLPVNDAPSFQLTTNLVVAMEDTPVTRSNFALNIQPGPSNESTQKVNFVVTSADPSFFSKQPAISTNGTLTFTPASDAIGDNVVVVVLEDNGGTAFGGVNRSLGQVFIVAVTPGNDAPSFKIGPSQTAPEDAPPQIVSNWATKILAGPSNEDWQEVSFVVTNSNPALFTADGQPKVSSNGTLTYTPAPNAFGSASLSVRAQDDGTTANGGSNTSPPQTATITILPVNDRPSFLLATNLVTVAEDALPIQLTNFVVNITAGPANEADQGFTFSILTNSNMALFASAKPPAISSSGILSFALAPNAHGTSVVSVLLQDSAGINLGGINKSLPQTFNIVVTPVNDPPTIAIKPVTTPEDRSTNITFLVDDKDSPVSGVTVVATSSNTNLVGNSGLLVTGSGTNRTLAITPRPDANGTNTIRLVADDQSGGRSTNDFLLTILPVNDAPGFALLTELIITTNAISNTTITNFARNITKGPTNESGQVVTFLVTTSATNFFASLPTIGASGALTFRPRPDAAGTAVVSVSAKDDGGTNLAGINISSTQTFTVMTIPAAQQARPTATDKATGDNFGLMSALSGNTAVVGAPTADPGGINSAGAAYVFVRSGANWIQQAKLTASDGAVLDEFGANHSVAIDGNTILVGSTYADIAGKTDAGAVYVFVRSGTNWTQQAKLTAGDAAAWDAFGFGVTLAGDTAVIGALGARPDGLVGAGAAYVFVRNGTTWSQQAKLTASDKLANSGFGNSLSLSGETVLVGASDEHSGGLLEGGAAYVFVRNGTTWTEQAKLLSNNRAADDRFGYSVSLSGDTAVLGAQTGGIGRSGKAYVFVRNGTSWSQQAQLTASNPSGEARFGFSVAVLGEMALIGAPHMMAPFDAGEAYLFVRNGTNWTQQGILKASDATANDNFGRSVALSGGIALIGAIGADPNGVSNAGAVYVFAPFASSASLGLKSFSAGGTSIIGGDGSPASAVLRPVRQGETFRISVPTFTGQIYWLEFKDSFGDSRWKSISYVIGDGSELELIDRTANGPSRFYRVRVDEEQFGAVADR